MVNPDQADALRDSDPARRAGLEPVHPAGWKC